MTVFLTSAETTNEVVLQWHSTQNGDIVDNPGGISNDHFTLLAKGSAQLTVSGQSPQNFVAPHIIVLPTNLPYTFVTQTPTTTIFCVYNKCSGSADEIQHLVSKVTAIYPRDRNRYLSGLSQG